MPYVFTSHILLGLTRLHSLSLSVGRKGQVCGNLFSCNFTCSVAWPWFSRPFQVRAGERKKGKRKIERHRERVMLGWTQALCICLMWIWFGVVYCVIGAQIADVSHDFFMLPFSVNSSVHSQWHKWEYVNQNFQLTLESIHEHNAQMILGKYFSVDWEIWIYIWWQRITSSKKIMILPWNLLVCLPARSLKNLWKLVYKWSLWDHEH